MDFRKLAVLIAVAGAAAAVAQTPPPQLTARELFYVPMGLKSSSTTSASPAPTTKKAPTPATKRPTTGEKTEHEVAKVTPTEPRPARRPTTSSLPDGATLMSVADYKGPDPLGLRYSVLKRMEDRTWDEVATDSVFRSGDRIRVRVESNEDAYLYIVMRGSSGSWRVLFPSPEINAGNNHVEAMQPQVVPSGNGVFTFDAQKGEEKLFLVLSRTEVPDLENLIYDLNDSGKTPKPASKKTVEPVKKSEPREEKDAKPKQMMLAQNMSPIDDALVGRLRTQVLSRDLVFEKVDDSKPLPSGRAETAMYVVEKSGKPDARLIADIQLAHQ